MPCTCFDHLAHLPPAEPLHVIINDWRHPEYARYEEYWLCDDCLDSLHGATVVNHIEAMEDVKFDITTCCACGIARP
jgi:hypothetical protein